MTFDCNLPYQPQRSPFLMPTSAINQAVLFSLLILAPLSSSRGSDCCLPAQQWTDSPHLTHPVQPSLNTALGCFYYSSGIKILMTRSALEDIPCAAVGELTLCNGAWIVKGTHRKPGKDWGREPRATNKCRVSGRRPSSSTMRGPVIASEGLVLVATTKQNGRMTEKLFEGEKREQNSSACGCTSLPAKGMC